MAGAGAVIAADSGGAACAPEVADETLGVFVAPAPIGSRVATCGSKLRPCALIAVAIARAQETSKRWVYLSAGTYAEFVKLPAGIALQGAWQNRSGVWSRPCPADRVQSTLIAAPSNVAVRVEGTERQAESVLDALTIQTKTAAEPGESLYGVYVSGPQTQLTLTDVIVVAAPAGAGARGKAGPAPTPAPSECSVDAPLAAVVEGTLGAGAETGAFDEVGYQAARGSAGSRGAAGRRGS
ncbi:MAG: hypothetical protein RL701_738, partial [Pseudomonadota bacterium]